MGIDALINQDGQASYEELQAVFGEHADEFLKFCDKDDDKKLTKDEFTGGILKDCDGMSQEDFNANWAERMEGVVKAAEDNKAAEAPARTLVYFAGLRSRGEPCRIVAAYGGITMTDELLTFEQWGERKSDKCPHLPYISKPDGSTLHETVDILEHLAVMGGKFVVDANQKAMATKINAPPFMCVDPYLNMPEPMWTDLGVPPFAEFPAMIAPELKKLAEELGDKKFFAGDTPGYGEAFLWHNLNNIKTCCHDE